MIQAFFDTNTLAPGVVGFRNRGSTPGELLRRWRAGQFELVTAEVVLSELSRTLQNPYFAKAFSRDQVELVLELFREEARLATVTKQVEGVASHPEDDLILAAALSADVAYIVSGDKQLLKLGTFQGIQIVSPRRFLDILDAAAPSPQALPDWWITRSGGRS